MENKIQQLTSKLYEEGLQKGKSESEKMISEAKIQAENIVKEARKSAEEILKQASERDAEMHNAAMRDVSLAAKRVITDLKESVKSVLSSCVVSEDVKTNFNNTEFVASLITLIIENWSKQNPNAAISVAVPTDKVGQFTSFITQKTAESLRKNLEIKSDSNIGNGFRIASSENGFYISFTDDQFENFFKEYIRVKVAEMVFGKQ